MVLVLAPVLQLDIETVMTLWVTCRLLRDSYPQSFFPQDLCMALISPGHHLDAAG